LTVKILFGDNKID
jgi:dynein heavy chain